MLMLPNSQLFCWQNLTGSHRPLDVLSPFPMIQCWPLTRPCYWHSSTLTRRTPVSYWKRIWRTFCTSLDSSCRVLRSDRLSSLDLMGGRQIKTASVSAIGQQSQIPPHIERLEITTAKTVMGTQCPSEWSRGLGGDLPSQPDMSLQLPLSWG